MKKTWNVPSIEVVELANTEYSTCPSTRADNTFGGYEEHNQVCS